MQRGGNHRVSLKCQYLEIYNESISDLLRPGSSNLQLREHYKRGCHVEGLAEVTALNCEIPTKACAFIWYCVSGG